MKDKKYYGETQKRYYQKNAEKIKAANKARYYANKAKTKEIGFYIEHLEWEVNKLARITNVLAGITAFNAVLFMIVALTK